MLQQRIVADKMFVRLRIYDITYIAKQRIVADKMFVRLRK